jgi:hypothetical protein
VTDAVYLCTALVVATAAVFKLHALRRDARNSASRFLCLTLVALAAALAVQGSTVHAFVNELVGGNRARLLGNALTVVAALGVQGTLAHLLRDPRAARRTMRRSTVVAVAALALMAVLFTTAPVEGPTRDFAATYGREPLFLAYLLVYLGYLSVALSGVLSLTRRYARHTERVFLRVGLRLMGLGAMCGLLYVGYKATYFLLLLMRHRSFGVESDISTALAAAAALLVTVGATIPAWGPPLARISQRFSQWHAYRRLRPLWGDLSAVAPDIGLTPVTSGLAKLALRDAGIHLYRRVIEIYDGRMALRPYLDKAVADRARLLADDAGLVGTGRDAVVEAARLAAGIDAMKRGTSAVEEDSSVPPSPGGTSLSDEAAWLIQVAHAYRQSPVVHATLRQLAIPTSGGRTAR